MFTRTRCVLFLFAFAAASTLEAGVILSPDADEVILELGESTVDESSGTANFELWLHFGSELRDRSISFVGINVESSSIDGAALAEDSTVFSAFQFIPAPDSAINDWFPPVEAFGSGAVLGLEEHMGIPDLDVLPPATDDMLIGTLVFNYGLAGLSDGQQFTIDLTGGGPGGDPPSSTDTTIGLNSDSEFEFLTPTFAPGERTVVLGEEVSNRPVPEPAGIAIYGVIAALLLGRRLQKRGQDSFSSLKSSVPRMT